MLSPDQVVREALQARLLAELFSQTLRRELILKGGLAMRFGYGSHRLTKDIDLDSPHEMDRAHVQALIKRAIVRALSDGLVENPVVTSPKLTDTTLRFKIGGKVPGGVSEIHLTIEVSRREILAADHVVKRPLPDRAGKAPILIDVYDGPALAANKVVALTSPNRIAPRDLFDLSVLIDMKIEPPVELLARRGKESVERALAELWSKIEAMDWALFRDQVIPFMPPEIGMTFDEASFEAMQLKVGTHVETWLKDAKRTFAP